MCEQHHPVEKELHSWADPIHQSIKLVLHEQFDVTDAGPTGGEVLWVCGSRVGPCGFKLPVYCNLLPYSILDIEYEMTQFAFYYVGIGAAVFLLGYFQVILFLTVTSDVLEILTLVPQIGGIICILSNRSLCGWQLLPNRFSSSGKCTSGKWWGWRSAGSTAPPLASSTLVCQSECSNDDFASGQRLNSGEMGGCVNSVRLCFTVISTRSTMPSQIKWPFFCSASLPLCVVSALALWKAGS